MSDVVKRDLYGLIDKELEAANQKFPLFNSTHEAFAVILEEAEEAKEEAGNLDVLMNNFWGGGKESHDPAAGHGAVAGRDEEDRGVAGGAGRAALCAE